MLLAVKNPWRSKGCVVNGDIREAVFCFVAGQRQSESWGEGSRWGEMRERQQAGRGAGKHPQLSSAGTHCSYPWSSLQLSTCPQISSPCPGLQPCLNRPTFPCPLPASQGASPLAPLCGRETQCSLTPQLRGGRHVLYPTAGGEGDARNPLEFSC